ncbi:MAG: hypothetical protein ACOX4D_08745 [Bacteroidales bacterium]|jgi:hypothetical protein
MTPRNKINIDDLDNNDVLKKLFNDIELESPSYNFAQNVMESVSKLETEAINDNKLILKQVGAILISFFLILNSLVFIFRDQIKNFFIVYVLPIINHILKNFQSFLDKISLGRNLNFVTIVDYLFIGLLITIFFIILSLLENDNLKSKAKSV